MTTHSMKKVSRAKPAKKHGARSRRAPRGKHIASRATEQRNRKPSTISARKNAKPLSVFAGMWTNDETFDEFVASMQAYRERIEADASQP